MFKNIEDVNNYRKYNFERYYMISDKVLWFVVGLFIGSSIGFLTSSLLVAAGLEERTRSRL